MMAVGTVLIGRVERGQDREGSGAVAKRSVAVGRPPHLGSTVVYIVAKPSSSTKEQS